jgi:chromosome segregation ATPase
VANLDDLEARVTHLEHSVADVRQDAAAARVMAGAADRDVSEFRQVQSAHTKVLNALRETQVEHGKRLDSLEDKVSTGFSMMSTGMAQITAMLVNIERKIDDK